MARQDSSSRFTEQRVFGEVLKCCSPLGQPPRRVTCYCYYLQATDWRHQTGDRMADKAAVVSGHLCTTVRRVQARTIFTASRLVAPVYLNTSTIRRAIRVGCSS